MKPKSVANLVTFGIVLLIFGFVMYNLGGGGGRSSVGPGLVSSVRDVVRVRPKTAAELADELRKKEVSEFWKYIEVSATHRPALRLGGREIVISGDIKNNAEVAMFLDISIEVAFFSKTGSLVSTERVTVYESICSGCVEEFRGLRVSSPLPYLQLGDVKFRVIGAIGK